MSGTHPNGSVPPKATLFCPDCGHRSHVDGEWLRDDSSAVRRLRCPECGVRVDGTAPLEAD